LILDSQFSVFIQALENARCARLPGPSRLRIN
jgi:hypothetical protein